MNLDTIGWPLPIDSFNVAIVHPIVSKAIVGGNVSPPISNANSDFIARFLAQASPLKPSDLLPGVLESWLSRVPGYADDPGELSEAERAGIIEAWKDELGAFEVLDKHFGLERSREPLPLQVELNVLRLETATKNVGFLLEFPEPVDWARIKLHLGSRPTGSSDPWASKRAFPVINPERTRAFVFEVSGGVPVTLDDKEYRLFLTFHRDIGSRNPLLKAPTPPNTEVAELIAVLPDGHFEQEAP